MKTNCLLLIALLLCTSAGAQFDISGRVQDAEGSAVAYASVALYTAADSTLTKVEATDDDGRFVLRDIVDGVYNLTVISIGVPDLQRAALTVDRDIDLGVLSMSAGGIDLEGATVTASRALIEVKPDRTRFNVQGTINAAGNDALGLLRMSPGVTLDNNDNISVLSRSGVIIYVDGRRLPLDGADLTNYLRSLTSEQIQAIEIISSPGAKYEAEGNAGIIDIRLKKAENEGANGSLSASGSQGRYAIYSLNGNGNYRNRHFNLFGNLSYTANESFTRSNFRSSQNNFLLLDDQYSRPLQTTPAARLGIDFYLGKRHTLGALYSGQFQHSERNVDNQTLIISNRDDTNVDCPCAAADSVLLGGVDGQGDHNQNTFNLNYNYAIASGHNLNVDLDYGRFRNDDVLNQPNRYVTPEGRPLSEANAYFETPIDIDIYTARLDYDFPVGKGAGSAGAKFTRVSTDNAFLAYDGLSPGAVLAGDRSNGFTYDENVYAAYLTYAGKFGNKVSYNLGLRMEATHAEGVLRTIPANAMTMPVDSNYLSLFPNAGLTYQLNENQILSLRYGRRINRPDYNVLNPFRVQLNQLSYEAGNPTLGPEIVNNIQLGWNIHRRYNLQLAYSHTEAAIARLFSPDDSIPQAGFATYDNLAKRSVYSFSGSAPFTVTDWWNVYVSVAASYVSNEADFGAELGRDATVDVEQFNYQGFIQNTFSLPADFTAEISARYISAGVSEGIFEYRELSMINLGLQRKFLSNQLNVKLSANDIFRGFVINGTSDFNGLYLRGNIVRDSRRVALSVSYNFGNQKVSSRRRDTGLDEAAGRVK